MSACPPVSTGRGHVRPLSAPIGRTNGHDGRIQTGQTATLKYAITVDITDRDGELHRIGISHREGKWECYRPQCRGRRCPHIPAAIEAARALPMEER